MRVLAVVWSVVCAAASAQTLQPGPQGAQFFGRAESGVLKCQVQPLRPVLDFSLRFHAGYTVLAPMNQYNGPGHRWRVGLRIQAASAAEPVYFVDRLRLPDVAPPKR
jgi:hypothetical protein